MKETVASIPGILSKNQLKQSYIPRLKPWVLRLEGRSIILALMMVILMSGCGEKSFPVVPDQPLPAAVSDLSHVMEMNRVKLSWTTPPCTDCSSVVHMFRQPLTEPFCETCPIPFKRILDIPAELFGGSERIDHVEPIEKGYRYIFKVNVHSGGGAGPDSNLIKFEY